MSSFEGPRHCDYIQVDNPTYTFTVKLAELSRIEEQVAQIDSHIHELHKLRSSLLHHSNYLRSPAYAMPDEVLLSIFLQLIDLKTNWTNNTASLRQAITLSSVSPRWRRIMVETPTFWRNIDLCIPGDQRRIHSLASFVEQCALRARSLDISLINPDHIAYAAGYLRPITRVFSSSVTTQSVKTLKLSGFLPDWAPLISLFSLLHVLHLWDDVRNPRYFIPKLNFKSLELGELCSLTQVHINIVNIQSITLPPSVEDLYLATSNSNVIIPILYQCPNLRALEYKNENMTTAPPFPEPLNLNSLKKLVWLANVGVGIMESAKNLGIPAVEHLKLTQRFSDSAVEPEDIIAFCHQGFANLSSLSLHYFCRKWSLNHLLQLFRHPLSNLKTLDLRRWSYPALLNAVYALTPVESEQDNRAIAHTPILQFLTLGEDPGSSPHDPTSFMSALVAMFKGRKAGINFPFHLNLFTSFTSDRACKKSPQPLQDELKHIVNTRQVRIMREGQNIYWLVPPSM